jgi:CheY-like chemotaxis protein
MARNKYLIVDDGVQQRKALYIMLKINGIKPEDILQAADGDEAVQIFKDNKESIGCILMDGEMPKKGGIDAFKEIREIDSTVSVIFNTESKELQEIIDTTLLDQFTTRIDKPIKPALLKEKLGQVGNFVHAAEKDNIRVVTGQSKLSMLVNPEFVKKNNWADSITPPASPQALQRSGNILEMS